MIRTIDQDFLELKRTHFDGQLPVASEVPLLLDDYVEISDATGKGNAEHFIQTNEACTLFHYWDSVGQQTWGWGSTWSLKDPKKRLPTSSTERNVACGDGVKYTLAECDLMFKRHLETISSTKLMKKVKNLMQPHEYNAILDAVYNQGEKGFFGKITDFASKDEVSAYFLKATSFNPAASDALNQRHARQRSLFINREYGKLKLKIWEVADGFPKKKPTIIYL